MQHHSNTLNDSAWVFPMRYPIKIIGESQYPMLQIVAELLCPLFPDFDTATLTCRSSAGGRYLAISAEVLLLNREQVDTLYAQLAACPSIKWAI